jgi:prolipoprotein diacylglyceryltransferase
MIFRFAVLRLRFFGFEVYWYGLLIASAMFCA